MPSTYAIHPGIGIARVGDSPEEFYLSPEATGSLPIGCTVDGETTPTNDGGEQTTTRFRDDDGRVLRQGARFTIFVYDEKSPKGRPLQIGDTVYGPDGHGVLKNIHWYAYLANKKSSWYEFKELAGEHGYAPTHPLRNADVKGDARSALMIDPGPQTVDTTNNPRATFARDSNAYATTFPPALSPNSIDTLGEMLTDNRGRLILLGGHGASGSYRTGLGEPRITSFSNNDGWFDDVADGPVTAILEYFSEDDKRSRIVQVDESAWALVGNPGYAPELVNMITLDDTLYDVAVRELDYEPYLYGQVADDTLEKRFNPAYRPYFYRDIWPILLRPFNAQYTTLFLADPQDAHEIGAEGDFEEAKLSQPPTAAGDPYGFMRMFVFDALRKPGQENAFENHDVAPEDRLRDKPLMPLLCGDNPLSNELTSKFLTLTPTMLFLLEQWARGLFINERSEGIDAPALEDRRGPGAALDHGVLANVLGGSFCPGGEIGWIARNPAIYSAPYRVKSNPAFLPNAAPGRAGSNAEFFPPALSFPGNSAGDPGEDLSAGLQPGDLTKRSALPWQVDFNECSTQQIDVTYEAWAVVYDSGGDPATRPAQTRSNLTLWWPTHRPMQVWRQDPVTGAFAMRDWVRGIPQTNAGDLKMVSAWRDLGFIIADPNPGSGDPAFYEVQALIPSIPLTPAIEPPAALPTSAPAQAE
ncbi:MAG: hypothetical protein QOJ46_1376 [bacterium]